jgi:hypothetical protein
LVLHIDMPAGRFVITVRCAGEEPAGPPERDASLH